jgi:hypothetical protein
MLAILLEFFGGLLSSVDDLFKAIITAAGIIFSGGKVWEFLQKRREGKDKIEEAKINAEKEIQSNKDKHHAEIERANSTITHQAGEIQYKDTIILKNEETIREYKRKNEELVRINDAKDEEIRKMHERLLECEKSKNK